MTSETKKKTPARKRKKKAKITPKAKLEQQAAAPAPGATAAQAKQVDVGNVAASAPATTARTAADSEPPAKAAPKRKKTRRKKAARQPTPATEGEAQPDKPAADAPPEPAKAADKPQAGGKPRRKKRKKRSAAAESGGSPAAAAPSAGGAEARDHKPDAGPTAPVDTEPTGDKTGAGAPAVDAGPDKARTADKDAPAAKRERTEGEKKRRAARKARRSERKKAAKRKPSSDDVELVDEEDDADFDADLEDAADALPARGPDGKRTMLINVSAGDECRIAIVHQNRLEELFIERASSASHVGNIYKGRVMNVESHIQAAFVDFGLAKNGFLHISDVQPQYFPDYAGEPEDVGRKIPRRSRPPIQECFRRGQEVIVQVIKEGVGTKGPTLTTYLSIPGRFLVMMPGMSRTGVSRKIEDDDARREMREALNELKLPPGIGFILRTAGRGRAKRDLQRDLNYLLRLWKTVVARVKKLDAPAELYRESDLVTRTLRDLYSADFERVVVDDADAAKRSREFLQIAMPRSKAAVELYSDREPLFHRFGIEQELENINMREVPLRSGGSLVIDTTEALVAIDINSGRFRSGDDAEEMAYRLNLEAAEEIARQLRLRDLGGLIVCDFVDMRLDRHKRAVERALRDALKEHKERARILRMSAFGLIEMTRQRRGPSMKRNTYFECQHCKGTGLVKMPESVVLDVMRIVQLATNRDGLRRVVVTVSSGVAYQILNRKRAVLAQIETETGRDIVIRGDETFTSDQVECVGEDSRGQPVPIIPAPARQGGRHSSR